MSGFWNNTNTGRVAKMIDTLTLIEKSAKANKAEAAEVAELLAPLTDALRALGADTSKIVDREVTVPEEEPEDGVQTISDTKVRWEPTDRDRFVTKLTAREFVHSRPADNPQELMDLIYLATAELDSYLYQRGDTRGGKA